MSMEMQIFSPLPGQQMPAIEFNYDELKSNLTASLAMYKGIIYDENAIGQAKTTRANMNKFKEFLESERKRMKKVYLEPYEAYEVKIKTLTGMVDEQVAEIDKQVKAFEQAEKDKKLEAIKTAYGEYVGDLRDLVPFERVFQDKWLNKTEKLPGIENSMVTFFSKVRDDLATITNLKSEYELAIKDTYLRTFDLGAALNEKTRLEQQKAKMEEYAAAVKPVQATPPVSAHATATADVPLEPVRQVDFRVWATEEQLRLLREFLIGNGIKYGKVSD